MKYFWQLIIFFVLFPLWAFASESQDDMKPFPLPIQGFERFVITLPALESEQDSKVGILIGKTLAVDCNQAQFIGNLATHVVQGWGYSYHVLDKAFGPATTLMACPPDEEVKQKFVYVRGEGFLQRYNSKLPLVIYVPTGFQVRYRIWTAGSEIGQAEAR